MNPSYKIHFSVSFKCGSNSLSFEKQIELPFVPVIGMSITFEGGNGLEIDLELNDDEYCSTIINYDIPSEMFLIFVRHSWKHKKVSHETIDSIIGQFSKWEKFHDDDDVKKLKDLMK